ncbi:MAG TPA: PRC-barrel domain-containing protein [Thermodesulfobacteriota bacterium]|nr:PRC-barrel domain-containing protein [Thermodesulfobacteriota bacterium]
MNKTLWMFALVSLLSLGLVVSSSHAASAMKKQGFRDLNSMDLIGASVKGSSGKLIGVVSEVMVDNGGHAFAVINHGDYDLYGDGGVNTPVPIEALRIYETKAGKEVVLLNIDTEHLDFAPFLDPTQMKNREYEANIYEYYGIRPYWDETNSCSK